MVRGRTSKVLLFFALFFLLAGLVAGCGGGDQSGNGSQDGTSGGEKKQAGGDGAGGGEDAKKEISRPKIALGTITRVDAEARRIILRPSTEKQGEKPLRFRIKPKATITLDNEQVEVADIKKGQQAQITYVVRNERNVAREVKLINGGGAAAGGEETG